MLKCVLVSVMGLVLVGTVMSGQGCKSADDEALKEPTQACLSDGFDGIA